MYSKYYVRISTEAIVAYLKADILLEIFREITKSLREETSNPAQTRNGMLEYKPTALPLHQSARCISSKSNVIY
jgi:hypothetical protein